MHRGPGKQLHSAVAAAAWGAVQGGVCCAAHGEDAGAAAWEPLESLETLHPEIKVGAGLDRRPSITQAMSLLRDKGAGQLAPRLGNISQLRSVAGHPDVSLQDDIHKVFDSGLEKEEHGPSHEDRQQNTQQGELHRQELADAIGTKLQGIERHLECLGAKLKQASDLPVKPMTGADPQQATLAIGKKQMWVDSETAFCRERREDVPGGD
ncbi:unnamed protein product [Prorocentrum cordatum]|uniref:Uncharacterized protein n=1 Tax=Prorocentrum cordatum TaxID=2364126 RepID=A0ABN9W3F9_9DINO|nr:unnamed protein product [Polarella glacialis]